MMVWLPHAVAWEDHTRPTRPLVALALALSFASTADQRFLYDDQSPANVLFVAEVVFPSKSVKLKGLSRKEAFSSDGDSDTL